MKNKGSIILDYMTDNYYDELFDYGDVWLFAEIDEEKELLILRNVKSNESFEKCFKNRKTETELNEFVDEFMKEIPNKNNLMEGLD